MLVAVERQLHPAMLAVVVDAKDFHQARVTVKLELAAVEDAEDGFRTWRAHEAR
jgi:hypothetical protein